MNVELQLKEVTLTCTFFNYSNILKNVSSLNLISVNICNANLQEIFKEMTQLTELVIFKCLYSSHYLNRREKRFDGDVDFGFTGENIPDGYSISNLNKLKWLTVYIWDANLGDSTLLHISRLKHLHSLNINCKSNKSNNKRGRKV